MSQHALRHGMASEVTKKLTMPHSPFRRTTVHGQQVLPRTRLLSGQGCLNLPALFLETRKGDRLRRSRGPVVVFRVRHDARRGDDRILPVGVVVLVAGYQHDLEDYTQAKAVIARIIHN